MILKTGQAAKALGVDPKTILNWIDNPLLNKFFSDGAAGRDKQLRREIDQHDLLILNTIRTLREAMPNNATDWRAICDMMDRGHVNDQLPPSALTANTGVTDFSHMRTALVLKSDLDNALAQVTQYERLIEEREQRIQTLERERDELRDKYTNEIMQLREERAKAMARAEMELELWRSGRLKPTE